ncbi:sulfatase-like hydrolase/transferase [Halorubrum sp. C191]|uniref:sulfatase-like hydrolase/transferase n=1 Tax=Halorubrum sp. C191 TaxID=1383842 RepID=UPI0018ED00AF|nr:sulfatase-like hydrolase/transferase [Halorubrum sp. C191]
MPPSDSSGDTPRNVLCILTDQQRQDSIGAYGNDVVETPNLDALAAEGNTFRPRVHPDRHLLAGPRLNRHRCLADDTRGHPQHSLGDHHR